MAENQKDLIEVKKEVKHDLRVADAWYVVFSKATRMPYVECDPETFDDQVLVYFTEEEAKAEVARLLAENEPTQVLMVEKKGALPFCVNLFFMGVNCMLVGRGTDREVAIQLKEFVERHEPTGNAREIMKIENPELHLTALYFVQELRRQKSAEMTDKLKEFDEELKAHFGKGKYLIATKDQHPCILQRDGKEYQPLFTDYQEFWKFSREKKFIPAVLPAANLHKLLTPNTAGVIINPLGVNLMLNVTAKKKVENKEENKEA